MNGNIVLKSSWISIELMRSYLQNVFKKKNTKVYAFEKRKNLDLSVL
jgi:hypothetical protein